MPGPTPEQIAAIAAIVERGNFAQSAAKIIGIRGGTWSRWLKRGRDVLEAMDVQGYEPSEADIPYIELVSAVDHAQAKADDHHLSNIHRAGKTQWQASAWYLERRDPQNWGRRERGTIDIRHHAGVLKAPAVLTADAWQTRYNKAIDAPSDNDPPQLESLPSDAAAESDR